jgi:hypothetical protein
MEAEKFWKYEDVVMVMLLEAAKTNIKQFDPVT